MALAEWEEFVGSVPWLLRSGANVEVSASAAASGVAELRGGEFPALHRLLDEATSTPVRIDDERFELLTWLMSDGTRLGWLCLLPSTETSESICPAHQRLAASFGGVAERSSNEPHTWLLNCDEALTTREAQHSGSFLDQHIWMMEDHGGSWPIDASGYYSICREANGNTTLCNRDDGSIVVFAADHSFDHLEPLEGCPPYSLYQIPAAPDLPTWVDVIANQWIDAIV